MSLRNICDNAKSASYALITASVTSIRQDTRAEHNDHHKLEATEMDRYQGVKDDDHHSELREDARATAIDEHERYFPTLVTYTVHGLFFKPLSLMQRDDCSYNKLHYRIPFCPVNLSCSARFTTRSMISDGILISSV